MAAKRSTAKRSTAKRPAAKRSTAKRPAETVVQDLAMSAETVDVGFRHRGPRRGGRPRR